MGAAEQEVCADLGWGDRDAGTAWLIHHVFQGYKGARKREETEDSGKQGNESGSMQGGRGWDSRSGKGGSLPHTFRVLSRVGDRQGVHT